MSENTLSSSMVAKTGTVAHHGNSATTLQIIDELRSKKAGDIMKAAVKTIESTATVGSAMKALVTRRVTGLPVTKCKRLIGMITEKDILNLILRTGCQSSLVGDHMTTHITTFNKDDSVGDIFDCLMQKHFRRVPILHDGKIAGVVSRADLVRVFVEMLRVPVQGQVERQVVEGFTAGDLMTSGLLVTRPHASVLEAMSTIVAHEVTGLPVVDDGLNLVGMLSEKDLLTLWHDSDLRSRQVHDFMSYDLTAARMNTGVFDICECLANSGFRRLPIVECGRLVGIISRSDLITFILKNPSALPKCTTASNATGAQ
jgi:CBS domain-containing protein